MTEETIKRGKKVIKIFNDLKDGFTIWLDSKGVLTKICRVESTPVNSALVEIRINKMFWEALSLTDEILFSDTMTHTIAGEAMINTLDFAALELKRLGVSRDVKRDTISILKILKPYDADTALEMLLYAVKLRIGRPLTSLTWLSDEWGKVGDLLVNKRFPAVRMQDGKVFNTHKYCYLEPGTDTWFYSSDSVEYITLPCAPEELKPEYRVLFFKIKYVPLKWAVRLHLYREVQDS